MPFILQIQVFLIRIVIFLPPKHHIHLIITHILDLIFDIILPRNFLNLLFKLIILISFVHLVQLLLINLNNQFILESNILQFLYLPILKSLPHMWLFNYLFHFIVHLNLLIFN